MSQTNQVDRHVRAGTLAVHKYHSSGRTIDLAGLLFQDIVITTYATLNSEFRRGTGLLDKIEWFRLILDEGDLLADSCRYSDGLIMTLTLIKVMLFETI